MASSIDLNPEVSFRKRCRAMDINRGRTRLLRPISTVLSIREGIKRRRASPAAAGSTVFPPAFESPFFEGKTITPQFRFSPPEIPQVVARGCDLALEPGLAGQFPIVSAPLNHLGQRDTRRTSCFFASRSRSDAGRRCQSSPGGNRRELRGERIHHLHSHQAGNRR